MKYGLTILFIIALSLSGCGDSGTNDDSGDTDTDSRDYRQDMREFVQHISGYAKSQAPDFIVIPQNGHELLTADGESDGAPAADYVAAIDGVGREDLLYGYDDDNAATPKDEWSYMAAFMDIAEANGVEVLVTDYCSTHSKMDDSYAKNSGRGYISFAADHRELDNIPSYPATPFNANADNVASLKEAKNFLYLLNPGEYGTKESFLAAVGGTDYDAVIIDLFFDGSEELSASDIDRLKVKKNGASRLLIAYMSIGEAEDYRYYWDNTWTKTKPSWLAGENPDWKGNFKVRYWDESWQAIISGSGDSYIGRILDAGFDGVYLDIIDAFEYFEDRE